MAVPQGFVDQDQQWLLSCLSATLDPNHEVRCFAEASLTQASLQPGMFQFSNPSPVSEFCYFCGNDGSFGFIFPAISRDLVVKHSVVKCLLGI